jgi:hypothetical protein
MTKGGLQRSGLEWFSSLPACLLLLAVVLFSTSSDIHNQMLRGGEQLWSGYYKLRMDSVQPEWPPGLQTMTPWPPCLAPMRRIRPTSGWPSSDQ